MKEKNKKEKLAFELELAKADLETAHYFQSILRKTTLFLFVLCVLSIVFTIKFLVLFLVLALLSLAIIAKSNVNFSKKIFIMVFIGLYGLPFIVSLTKQTLGIPLNKGAIQQSTFELTIIMSGDSLTIISRQYGICLID